MKIIDEKGRLFEKINIIDLLIVLVVIGALFGVNYKMGLLKKVTVSQQQVQKHIVKIWVKDVSPYTADAIKVGDVVKEHRSNLDIGKIIDKSVKPTMEKASNLDGKWVLSEVPGRKDVFITLETSVPAVGENLKLGSIDAKVGASIILKGPKFKVNSYIIGVE